jgi:hypothetical protein
MFMSMRLDATARLTTAPVNANGIFHLALPVYRLRIELLKVAMPHDPGCSCGNPVVEAVHPR